MRRPVIWFLTVVLSFAAGAGLILVLNSVDRSADRAQEDEPAAYVCPMHSEIVADVATDCAICGMDLVPVERGRGSTQADAHAPVVTIRPEIVNSLGVRSVTVERRNLPRRIETVGYVEYDRTRLRHIFPAANGQIEDLALSSEGERVEKGQFLFQLFSPMLGSSADRTYAQQDGVVVSLDVIEGSYVLPTTRVITLADLASVWVLADVFEDQASWVRPGQPAEVRLSYVGGRVWNGKVEYVYPNLDPETRTLKARLHFDNPDELLKPNMHADVTIDCGTIEDVLAVPRDAVIETEREQRVILALGDGRFQPRLVECGAESGDWVEIVEGIAEGDRVVVASQFLIDSEANLRISLSRLTPGADVADEE
jgi:Cu(I)/Ag(I) efflux system membrane fusion protein